MDTTLGTLATLDGRIVQCAKPYLLSVVGASLETLDALDGHTLENANFGTIPLNHRTVVLIVHNLCILGAK
jgi:hypothetical protein